MRDGTCCQKRTPNAFFTRFANERSIQIITRGRNVRTYASTNMLWNKASLQCQAFSRTQSTLAVKHCLLCVIVLAQLCFHGKRHCASHISNSLTLPFKTLYPVAKPKLEIQTFDPKGSPLATKRMRFDARTLHNETKMVPHTRAHTHTHKHR